MSGHSKWSTIKHQKAKMDAHRGKLFTKLIREITVAARQGGGNPDANPRLRTAIQAAREANMPNENIQRAIKRGTGELPGVNYEELVFEGYAPGGVAVLVHTLTDNRNRASAEVKYIFSKHGGHLGGTGSVNWLFEKKGIITIPAKETEEETLLNIALETGAEDMSKEGDAFLIITAPEDLEKVKSGLKSKGVNYQTAEITMMPKNTVHLEGKQAEQVLRLVEALEDQDDVQKVYANFDIPDEILEKV